MLVLTRKVGEEIVVPQCQLSVTILDASPGRVRLGIRAPTNLIVHRGEVCERIRAKNVLDCGEAMKSVRILIADSDQFLVAAYRDHLCQLRALVSTALTGLACIEQLRAFTPDVLILDPTIPWGGGDGVLAVMHEESTIRPPLVLLLTRGQDRGLLYRISSFRVDDYQTKPLSAARLVDRICTLRQSRDEKVTRTSEVVTSRSPPATPRL